ncbi:MAG TPA: hypothetical protein VM597_16870, partial [Gemmataceae bacterium]|nr:hypothetical protein [Gemmataceae bacterium]
MSKTFLNLESLDGRALPSVTFSNGVLTITGTDGRDKVEVREVGDRLVVKGQTITVNGEQVRSIPAADVTRIAVSTGAEDDRIDLRNTSVPAVIDAGTGRDRVRSGSGDDTITGGSGDDWLRGGRGDDAVRGDAGDDSVLGGLGDDSCDGGVGDDRVRGGRGSDDCSGGSGNDNVSDIDDDKFRGRIAAIDLATQNVTVRRYDGSEVVVTINGDTELERFGDDVDLSAFRFGDRVKVEVGGDGFAEELETDDSG